MAQCLQYADVKECVVDHVDKQIYGKTLYSDSKDKLSTEKERRTLFSVIQTLIDVIKCPYCSYMHKYTHIHVP